MSASQPRNTTSETRKMYLESIEKAEEETGNCCWSENCCCCCCSICGLKRTTATRVNYTVFLFIGTIFCFIMLIPNLRTKLDSLGGFCGEVLSADTCDSLCGYSAVYRVCFAMGVFYFLMSLILIGVRTEDEGRAKFHNGFWYIKLTALVGISIGSMFIPRHSYFHKVWMYVGLAGGFLFILIQLLLLIDFAHCWNDSWVGKMEISESRCTSRCWYLALLVSTLFLYLLSVVAVALFYILFAHDSSCKVNTFFITFNLCHCLAASIISILPKIQEAQSGTGLLQAAVVTSYTMFLTWSALSHEPDDTCNPRDTFLSGYNELTGVNLQAIFSGILMFGMLIYASFSTAMSASKLSKWSLSKIDQINNTSNKESANETTYNYSFFHFILFLATLNIMMTLTNWYSPSQGSSLLTRSWPAVWVKMASSSACVWLYIWTLIAPVLRPLFHKYADEINGQPDNSEFRKDHKHYEENIHRLSPQKKSLNLNINDENEGKSSISKDLQAKRSHDENASKQYSNGISASDMVELNGAQTYCKSVTPPCVTRGDVNVTHGSMSRRNSSRIATPVTESDKEMLRMQSKVMRLQEKIAKLQNKVAVLQGLNV